jgi:urease alpha subunit
MDEFDLTIRNGTSVTAADTIAADVGIRNGRIAAVAASRMLNSFHSPLDVTVAPGRDRAAVSIFRRLLKTRPDKGAIYSAPRNFFDS